jgi:hypothetical protein
MRLATILVLLAIACLSACSTAAPKRAASPPPFQCTSPSPDVCELQEQFHILRFEQAEQISAIEEAERRRRQREEATASTAAPAPSVNAPLLDAPAG